MRFFFGITEGASGEVSTGELNGAIDSVISGSSAVSNRVDLLLPTNPNPNPTLLVAAAAAYLSGHADYETELPKPDGTKLNISSAGATTLEVAMQTARTLVNTTAGDQELCKNLRDADVDGLYKEVSGSIAEIRGRLSADDPRWETFGLNIPANPSPPEPVGSVTLTAAGPGTVLVSYGHARPATGYRIFKKVTGVDADFVFVDRAQDLKFTLKGLTPGQTVAVVVAATNDAGDAPLSPAEDIVVG